MGEGSAYADPMADNRHLRYGEKRLAFSSEKARDRANAQRAIEGLSQNDKIIWLLQEQAAMLFEQNQMLAYVCDRLYTLETRRSEAPEAGASE